MPVYICAASDPSPLFYCFCRHSDNSSVHPLHGLGRRILHLHLSLHHQRLQCHHSLLKCLPLLQGPQFQLPLPVQCLLTSLSHHLLLKLSPPPTALRTLKPSRSTHHVHRQAVHPHHYRQRRLSEEVIRLTRGGLRRRMAGGSGPPAS
jgi:hypothetical protein